MKEYVKEYVKEYLIVYYTRSGTTEIVAKAAQKLLNCDIEKINYAETLRRVTFFTAAFESVKKSVVEISGDTRNPKDYHIIYFITPVWAGRLSTPIRSYIEKYCRSIKNYVLVPVSSGSGGRQCEDDAEEHLSAPPWIIADYFSKEIKNNTFDINKILV